MDRPFRGRRAAPGVDIVVVAELMGHRRLDTTRLYTLPTDAGLEDAVAKLPAGQ